MWLPYEHLNSRDRFVLTFVKRYIGIENYKHFEANIHRFNSLHKNKFNDAKID